MHPHSLSTLRLYGLVTSVYTTGEMLPFQERKKFRKILYSKAMILVLSTILVFVAHGVWKIHQKATIARAEHNQVARALEEIGRREVELQTSLVLRRTDQGIENEIRQKFTVAKPWEEVVIVVDESDKKSKNDEVADRSFWAGFLKFWRK